MVRLDFRENTKMLTVPTNNIFDQKYFRNIIRTSLCNSRNSFGPILKPFIFVITTFLNKISNQLLIRRMTNSFLQNYNYRIKLSMFKKIHI